MAKFQALVTLEVDDVLNQDVQEYVRAAVQGWGGAFRPEDPFFGDNKEIISVSVKRVKKNG